MGHSPLDQRDGADQDCTTSLSNIVVLRFPAAAGRPALLEQPVS